MASSFALPVASLASSDVAFAFGALGMARTSSGAVLRRCRPFCGWRRPVPPLPHKPVKKPARVLYPPRPTGHPSPVGTGTRTRGYGCGLCAGMGAGHGPNTRGSPVHITKYRNTAHLCMSQFQFRKGYPSYCKEQWDSLNKWRDGPIASVNPTIHINKMDDSCNECRMI
jgi:hypothetical protein